MIHVQAHAFDKSSSATFSKSLAFETKEELNKQFKVFEEEVPFSKWYYELQTEEVLTEKEEEVLSEYDWC